MTLLSPLLFVALTSAPLFATTRRQFLASALALPALRLPEITRVATTTMTGPSLSELLLMNPYQLGVAVPESLARAHGLFAEVSRKEHVRRFNTLYQFLRDTPPDDLLRAAFTHLSDDELRTLIQVGEERLERSRTPMARDTECARKLQLPDVLRVWSWGPDLGRPLADVEADANELLE